MYFKNHGLTFVFPTAKLQKILKQLILGGIFYKVYHGSFI